VREGSASARDTHPGPSRRGNTPGAGNVGYGACSVRKRKYAAHQ